MSGAPSPHRIPLIRRRVGSQVEEAGNVRELMVQEVAFKQNGKNQRVNTQWFTHQLEQLRSMLYTVPQRLWAGLWAESLLPTSCYSFPMAGFLLFSDSFLLAKCLLDHYPNKQHVFQPYVKVYFQSIHVMAITRAVRWLKYTTITPKHNFIITSSSKGLYHGFYHVPGHRPISLWPQQSTKYTPFSSH